MIETPLAVLNAGEIASAAHEVLCEISGVESDADAPGVIDWNETGVPHDDTVNGLRNVAS